MSDLTETLIAEEEGRVPWVYKDSRGLDTIGIGCLVDHSVAGAGLCDAAIDAQFSHDSAKARAEAAMLPGFEQCNDVQRAVLVSMVFQLGSLSSWPKFKAALAAGNYKDAAAEGLNSMWAKQTSRRATREMKMLETGTWTNLDGTTKEEPTT